MQNSEILDVNGKNYIVSNLLGKGKSGYSYLVHDESGSYVIKQIHHEPCEYYRFGNKLEAELSAYKTLQHVGINMPEMLDFDAVNERILKEYIVGSTIYDLVFNNLMKPQYLAQINEMCRLLYASGLNIDYFPTNFVVKNDILYYIDYECNEYCEQWNFENWGIKYWCNTDI